MTVDQKAELLGVPETASLQEWAEVCNRVAAESGWNDRWDYLSDSPTSPDSIDHILSKIGLIMSEQAEAIEAIRDDPDVLAMEFTLDGKPEGFAVELIDGIIRTLHLLAMTGVTATYNLDEILREKLVYNASRGYKHGRHA